MSNIKLILKKKYNYLFSETKNMMCKVKGNFPSRFYLVALTIILITALLSACSEQKKEESQKTKQGKSQFTIGIESEPERLNPLTIKNPKTFSLSWQIYEGLLGLDDQGNIAPRLAKKWQTKDFKTWTFSLQDDAYFHQSEIFNNAQKTRRVKADDVLSSYTAFCSSEAYPSFLLTDSIEGCADYNAGKAKSVNGLQVIDDHTFQITLLKPEPFFLNRLTTAWIAIFPKEERSDANKEAWGLQTAVGTGPYRLKSKTDSELVLERNEQYWDKSRQPKIDKLVYRVLKNDQIRLAELKNGNIDLMVVPNTLFPAILDQDGHLKKSYEKDFHTTVYTTFNSNMIGFNLNNMTDVHLRRAIYYGTDRESIVKKLLFGYGDVTGGTVPPGIRGYISPFNDEKLYDPELAKKELQQSKYKGEDIELLVHEVANSEQVGQIFQSQMKALGINIKLTKLDFGSVIGRMIKGDAPMFGMFFDYVLSSPEPILLNLYTSAKRPVPNFWQYSNKKVDQEIEQLRNISDTGESNKQCALIEAEVMKDVPAIFLYREKYLALYSKKFSGLSVNLHGRFEFEQVKTVQ